MAEDWAGFAVKAESGGLVVVVEGVVGAADREMGWETNDGGWVVGVGYGAGLARVEVARRRRRRAERVGVEDFMFFSFCFLGGLNCFDGG